MEIHVYVIRPSLRIHWYVLAACPWKIKQDPSSLQVFLGFVEPSKLAFVCIVQPKILHMFHYRWVSVFECTSWWFGTGTTGACICLGFCQWCYSLCRCRLFDVRFISIYANAAHVWLICIVNTSTSRLRLLMFFSTCDWVALNWRRKLLEHTSKNSSILSHPKIHVPCIEWYVFIFNYFTPRISSGVRFVCVLVKGSWSSWTRFNAFHCAEKDILHSSSGDIVKSCFGFLLNDFVYGWRDLTVGYV